MVGGVNNGPLAPSLSSAEFYDSANENWTLTGSLNTGRYSHTATLLPNGKVLVAGGTAFGFVNLVSGELYDLSSGSWMIADSLNTARGYHTATLLPNGKVLVAGGYGSNSTVVLRSAELYDPAGGSWTVTGSLNIVRYDHTATLLPNGKVLVVGGHDGTFELASAELYDPGSTCSVSICHKHTTTLSLECGSDELRRHIDHGDILGPCPAAKKDAAQTDSLAPD